MRGVQWICPFCRALYLSINNYSVFLCLNCSRAIRMMKSKNEIKQYYNAFTKTKHYSILFINPTHHSDPIFELQLFIIAIILHGHFERHVHGALVLHILHIGLRSAKEFFCAIIHDETI